MAYQQTRAQEGKPESGKPESEKPGAVRVWLLGGFRVSVGSHTVEGNGWSLRKAASLIKLLALARGRRLHREQVMDALWPESGMKSAANNLNNALHFARRALDPTLTDHASRYLSLQDGLLALCPEGPLWVDVEAFESAAATARRCGQPAAYRAAIDLYAGDLLPEDRYERWADERREGLRQLYLALLVELAALYEEREEFAPAIETLQEVLANERTNEEAHAALIRLYAASGQCQKALLQYQRLQKVLSEDLGMEPDAVSQRLREEILRGDPPRGNSGRSERAHSRPAGRSVERPREGSRSTGRRNLPRARSSFVGREREMVAVKRSLAMTSLLTLTGAGGSGKTRLALEVAHDLAGAYPDGAWLVELAPLSDPALVGQAVAAALGVREQPGRTLTQTLSSHLASRQTLLVLDNCEHVVEAAAHLADALLGACPRLRILATSREPLGVPGEAVWPVPPLSLPDTERPSTVEGLMLSGAVRLFVERARSRLPGFELTRENAGPTISVCRKLDGIPLAIELASARMGALAVEQVAQRLDDCLGLLGGGGRTVAPRHRTLRATLEWSYALLSGPERTLFGRLSVFAGDWTLEASEAVGAGGGIERGEVLELLSGLVDKSVVVAEASPTADGPQMRYRMLEPIRQYGRERLEESVEAEAARSRHAAWFLDLSQRAEPELRGAQQIAWINELERERDNLRTAMAWLLRKGELETAARMGWALWLFWWMRGHFGEGRGWMEEALAKRGAMPAPARAKALYVAGTMAAGQADYRSAESLLEESLRLFRELRDKRGIAYALGSAGLAAVGQGQYERAIAFFEEDKDLLLKVEDKFGTSVALSFLAGAWFGQGDRTRAKRLAQRALALARELGAAQALCVGLYTLAMVTHASSDHDQTRRLFAEGLEISAGQGDESNVAYGLQGLAALAASEGWSARAARLWGAAEALLETIEVAAHIYAPDRSLHQSQVSAVRAGLDEVAFDAAWSEGRAMFPEQAIEYALSAEDTSPPAPPEPRAVPPDPLTRREREVALLVARGLTNRQIASELSISERTAENHVARLLKKLGFSSRARIAAWATERMLASEQDY